MPPVSPQALSSSDAACNRSLNEKNENPILRQYKATHKREKAETEQARLRAGLSSVRVLTALAVWLAVAALAAGIGTVVFTVR